MKELLYKFIFRMQHKVRFLMVKIFGLRAYASYRHTQKKGTLDAEQQSINYFTARPNPGAGIGHQMANWMAGYFYADFLGLKFAHQPFSNSHIPASTSKWEKFLNFGQGEVTLEGLLENGYKKVLIPKFENTQDDINVIKEIIDSYRNQKVVFYCEQDQFYKDLYKVAPILQKKFYAVHKRENENLIFNDGVCNIAVHVRRGDIVQKRYKENQNLTMRYQDNNYFINALKTAIRYCGDMELYDFQIYLFSQGREEDYVEFKQFENVHFCLNMDAMQSFLHMVYADVLITSKSSFSYKPGLLNKGLKFAPENFWHGYPQDESWILLDENGYLI